jgi:hypothetical protein
MAAGYSRGLAPAGKPGTEGLNSFRTPAAFLDTAMVTLHYSTATIYR